MNTCRARHCKKAIPTGHFCRKCQGMIPSELYHQIMFNSPTEEQLTAAAEAIEKSRSPANAIHPPSESRERFRAARAHTAEAMKILGRKS